MLAVLGGAEPIPVGVVHEVKASRQSVVILHGVTLVHVGVQLLAGALTQTSGSMAG